MFRMNLVIMLSALTLLCACTSPSPQQTMADTAGQGVVVSVKQPNAAFAPGSSFSWDKVDSVVYQDPRINSIKVQNLLHEAITNQLKARGYPVVAQGGRYEVAYVAALEDSLSDQELTERFGINPGMVAVSQDKQAYDKATVVIEIRDANDHTVLWRSVLQGFAVFNLDDEVSQARINRAVMRLFATLP